MRGIWLGRGMAAIALVIAQAAIVPTASAEQNARITYEQILADPDDVELNVAYAKQQITDGNLRGAASTLERVLLVNPNLPAVRLLYGVVLFRLDNIEESERELRSLDSVDMPAGIRKEVDDYLEQIAMRRKPTRIEGALSLGYHYDTNANAAPGSGSLLFLDTPFQLVDGSGKQDDHAFISILSALIRHDLGLPQKHEVFARLDALVNEQAKVDTQDQQALFPQLGVVFKTPWFNVAPSAEVGYLRLADQDYYLAPGGRLRFTRRFGQHFDAWADARFLAENFFNIREAVDADDRDGLRIVAGLGVGYALAPAHRLDFAFEFTNKDAQTEDEQFRREALSLGYTWAIGEGQYINLLGILDQTRYDGPDPFVSALTRKDKSVRLRATYGAPLGAFLGDALPDYVTDIVGSVAFEHYRQTSNITNFQFDNQRVQVLFTKRFGM